MRFTKCHKTVCQDRLLTTHVPNCIHKGTMKGGSGETMAGISPCAPLLLILQLSVGGGKGTGGLMSKQASLGTHLQCLVRISMRVGLFSCFSSSYLTSFQSTNDNLAIDLSCAPHIKPAPKDSFKTNRNHPLSMGANIKVQTLHSVPALSV